MFSPTQADGRPDENPSIRDYYDPTRPGPDRETQDDEDDDAGAKDNEIPEQKTERSKDRVYQHPRKIPERIKGLGKRESSDVLSRF